MIPSPGHVAQHPHGFARDLGADAIARQNQNVQIHRLVRRHLHGLLAFPNQAGDLFVHEPLFAMVGDRRETMVQIVELFPGKGEPEIVGALVERVAAAVLAQYELAFGDPHGAWVDDFVGRFFLEITVLMDAGFVRERVAADDGLVRLRPEGDDRAQRFAGRIQMLGVDAGAIRVRVAAGLEDHHDLFQRAVAGALTDAVDRALDLAGARFHRGQRVGDRETQVVMAVHADHGAIAEGLHDFADESAVFLRRRVADGIGNVHRAGAGRDYRLGDLFQETGLGARAVFGREFDVIDVAAGQLDGGDRFIEHLLLGLFELVLQMNIAGGDKGVDARPPGVLEALGGALDIERAAARERGDLSPGKLAAHRVHGFEIALAGDREARFQNVYAELDQLFGHEQLFGDRHAAAGGLLAVAQGRVENVYAVAHQVPLSGQA